LFAQQTYCSHSGRPQWYLDEHAEGGREAAEGILFRTGGSSAARDGETLQRYWRDLCTYWSHNTPSQSDALARRLAMLHLGIPLEREFQLPAAQGA
jgi:hypothetical protein